MKITYAAIIRQDQEDPCFYNVSIPDVWGAVTCGEGYENALRMAKDLLETLKDGSLRSFGAPTPIQETKENFPTEEVLPIEIDLPIDESFSFYFDPKKHPSKRNEKHYVKIGEDTFEVIGSIIDYRTTKIYLVNKEKKKIKEITNKDRKYFILQMLRSDIFSQLIKDQTPI